MSADTDEDLAPYVAVMLINLAEQHEGGLSAKRDWIYVAPRERFQLDIPRDTVDAALKLLQKSGIAWISNDRFAGHFVAIKKISFSQFVERVNKETEEYDRIVREAPDEHYGLNAAESRTFPYLELYTGNKALRSYAQFGEPWLLEVLDSLKRNDPVEAIPSGRPFSSAAWTGVEERMTPEKRLEIKDRVTALKSAIHQAEMSERQRANALRRVEAVETLIEAPDTPWNLIVELLNHKALTGFLNVTALLTLLFS